MIAFDPEKILFYSADLEREDIEIPFLAKHRYGDRELWFLAARHGFSTNSKTHQLIDQAFSELNPDAVIVEGMATNSPNGWDTDVERFFIDLSLKMEQKDPTKIGEPQYTLLLAMRNNVKIFSGEPSVPEQITYIRENNYTNDDYAGMDFLLRIGNWQLEGLTEQDMEKTWQSSFDSYRKLLSFEMTESFDGFRNWFKQHTGLEFSLNLIDNHFIAPNITQPYGSVQHLDGVLSNFRDRTILKTIEAALQNYHRVLIVYGGSHYWTLQPVLEASL